MAYCPDCLYFKGECDPDPEYYNAPCQFFMDRHDMLETERRANLPDPKEAE